MWERERDRERLNGGGDETPEAKWFAKKSPGVVERKCDRSKDREFDKGKYCLRFYLNLPL